MYVLVFDLFDTDMNKLWLSVRFLTFYGSNESYFNYFDNNRIDQNNQL